MKILLVELESDIKARKLYSMLSSMNFVKKVSTISKRKDLISVLKEHENVKTAIVKKKNEGIAKYL